MTNVDASASYPMSCMARGVAAMMPNMTENVTADMQAAVI
jgi:hypothetical protein